MTQPRDRRKLTRSAFLINLEPIAAAAAAADTAAASAAQQTVCLLVVKLKAKSQLLFRIFNLNLHLHKRHAELTVVFLINQAHSRTHRHVDTPGAQNICSRGPCQ